MHKECGIPYADLNEIPQKFKIVICPTYTEFYLNLINVESKGTISFTTLSDL